MRILAITDICGRADALRRLEEEVRGEELAAILFAGDALAGGRRIEEWTRARIGSADVQRRSGGIEAQEHEDARTLHEVLDTLARFGRPVRFVPGDLDAPERLVARTAASHELVTPEVQYVHRSFAYGPRNYVVAGFGGAVSRGDRETDLVQLYPEWEVETGLDFVRRLAPDRILLFHMPPRFGTLDSHRGEQIGSPVIEEIIHTHDPRLVVCGHAMDGQGRAMVGDSLVVNPGPLCRGQYAIVDLSTRDVSFRRLEGIAAEEPSAADRQLQARVEQSLEAEPATRGAGIRVDVRGGVARLMGAVRSIAIKAAAERTARAVGGVERVENALTADTAVAARVTARLADDRRTALAAIDVSAIAGEVTLMGAVPSQAIKQAAEEIARSVPGVALVVNELRVEPEEEPARPPIGPSVL